MSFTEQEAQQLMENARRGRGHKSEETPLPVNPAKPNKHHASICEADNIRFPSKKHRKFYLELRAQQEVGMIRYFLREVPFDLPGHYDNGKVVRHFVDFAVCENDNTVTYYEVKGRDLPMGKMKRKMVEDIYKIRIEVM